MIIKVTQKKWAIKLRKQGKTYSDILNAIPVAKSTLGIWLKEAKLSRPEKQRFTEARRLASLRGGQFRKKQRIEKQDILLSTAKSEISSISNHELFLIGVILYWAEGAKEKAHKPGSQLQFSNMDPRMIKVFLRWLLRVCKVNKNMLVFNIFLHNTHRNRVKQVTKYWSRITGFPLSNFSSVYWKRNKIKTRRVNVREQYHGLLKIKVRKSSDLVRKIAGWTEGIFENIK